MRTQIQRELDRAEEYFLTKLLGDIEHPQIGIKLQLFLNANKINLTDYINEKIVIFESIAKNYMNENGYFNGEQISQALVIKYPILQGLSLPDIKPIELLQVLDYLVGFDTLADWIKNF